MEVTTPARSRVGEEGADPPSPSPEEAPAHTMTVRGGQSREVGTARGEGERFAGRSNRWRRRKEAGPDWGMADAEIAVPLPFSVGRLCDRAAAEKTNVHKHANGNR